MDEICDVGEELLEAIRRHDRALQDMGYELRLIRETLQRFGYPIGTQQTTATSKEQGNENESDVEHNAGGTE